MRKPAILALLFCLEALDLSAQKPKKTITLTSEAAASGGREIVLCCAPVERFEKGEICSHVWTYPVGNTQKDKEWSLQVRQVCQDLKEQSAVAAPRGEWYLSYRAQPSRPVHLINCHKSQAWPPELSPPAEKPAPAQEDPAEDSPPQAPAEKVAERLKTLEKALAEQKSVVERLQDDLKTRTKADQNLEKKLEALRKQLEKLEEDHKNACYRIDDRYQGQEEVTIAVAGSVLRFLKVQAPESTVVIGLSDAKASEFLAEAQQQSTAKIYPHVFLAVPETIRQVQPFFLQDRLIDPQLYARLTGGKDANRVAHQDVVRFIDELNARCAPRTTFQLPSEEELVAAARRLYDPVASGRLKPCEDLRKDDIRSPITELFGHAWQLTRSLCQPFGESAKMSCPDNAYVRKGGAASSTDPLECLPEFRSAAPNDVNQKETSFRLVLKE